MVTCKINKNVAELDFQNRIPTILRSWSTSHNHMLPPNLPTWCTEIKCDKARWIALLNMEDGGYSLTFMKVINPNVIKVVAKSPCITRLVN